MQRGTSALVVFLIAIPIVILVAVGTAFLTRAQSGQIPAATTEPVPANGSVARQQFSSAATPIYSPASSAAATRVYKTDFFSAQIPTNWVATATQSGQLRSTQLHQINQPDYPSFTITKQPFATGQEQEMIASYQQLKLSPVAIKIGTTAAIAYRGTLPLTVENGKILHQPSQTTVVVYHHGAALYTMEFKYTGSNTQRAMEEISQTILQTLQIF